MIVNKPTATILAGLIVVAAILVIEYVRRNGAENRDAGSGMVPSHLSAEADRPTKENASKALKENIEHLRRVLELDSTNSKVAFELARLLQPCAGFVGHDSGISHLAAALGLPGLVLWADTREEIWRPPSDQIVVLRHPDGLDGLAVDEVMEHLLRLAER